uniref:Uncharacterized protein orf100d n=1 Tax=Beta vulgaris subsp. maritima TaxID=350892 RepID=E8ZC98_BETVM|nr:hypothetical protein [Beta vulgaris subsp. maritima]
MLYKRLAPFHTEYSTIVATLRNSRAEIFSIAGEAKTGCSLTDFGLVVVIGTVPLILNYSRCSVYLRLYGQVHEFMAIGLSTYVPSIVRQMCSLLGFDFRI